MLGNFLFGTDASPKKLTCNEKIKSDIQFGSCFEAPCYECKFCSLMQIELFFLMRMFVARARFGKKGLWRSWSQIPACWQLKL